MKEKELKEIMFDLFDTYEYCEDIINSLRSLESENYISNIDYNYLISNYEKLLKEWNNEN